MTIAGSAALVAADVDDIAVDAATTVPISSNWAFDHAADTDLHTQAGEMLTDTTPKTTGFTAVSGNRYLCDTSGGAFTMTLPLSPTAGDIVGFVDYGETFGTNALTVGRNSQEIMNIAADMTADVTNFSGALQFTGATRGWVLI